MSVTVTLRPLTPADLPAYRELYESAFPAGERKKQMNNKRKVPRVLHDRGTLRGCL